MTDGEEGGRWRFRGRRNGHVRRSDLWLYPELDRSAVVDGYYDCDGDEQLEAYVRHLRRTSPEELDRDAVPIYWSVCGNAGVHEAAPFSRAAPSGDFLEHYTWPHDAETGARLDWFRLPVVNDRFPKLAEALAWTPSPLQPTCPLRSILDSRSGRMPPATETNA